MKDVNSTSQPTDALQGDTSPADQGPGQAPDQVTQMPEPERMPVPVITIEEEETDATAAAHPFLPPGVTTVITTNGRTLTPEQEAAEVAAEGTAVAPEDRPAGAFFEDDDLFYAGTFTIDDGVHRPETIEFIDPDDELVEELLQLPAELAKKFDITIEQVGDQEWLNANLPLDQRIMLMSRERELSKRVRQICVKRWTFERAVTPESIEKLPPKTRYALSDHIMTYVMGGEPEMVFSPR